jgi:kynurenine formamidase
MPRWKVRPEGSNWGEFGDDDRLGRLNLLTPERRMAALREVEHGITFSLSLPLDLPGGNVLSHHRLPPKLFAGETAEGESTYARPMANVSPLFTDVVNDDAVVLYTQYSTQWDALGHVAHAFDADEDGQAEVVFYNGYHAHKDVVGPQVPGACGQPLGVELLATAGLQGRGVLVNAYSVYGRTRSRINYDALRKMLDDQKVEVRPGDIFCLYTGFADALLEQSRSPDAAMLRRSFGGMDGTDQRLLNWITDSGVAALCADNLAVEYVSATPRGETPHALLPLHEHCLFKLGLPLGELWYLKELADWLQANGRNSFLLTAPPLNLPGACGSPVTPIALV